MPRATSKTPVPFPRPRGAKPLARPLDQDANELMELAVDAAQSRHLPEFLERFAPGGASDVDLLCGKLGETPIDTSWRGGIRSFTED